MCVRVWLGGCVGFLGVCGCVNVCVFVCACGCVCGYEGVGVCVRGYV
jgi:hypothetical protein